MRPEDLIEVERVYSVATNIALGIKYRDHLEDIFTDDVMIYGTNEDEKAMDLKTFRRLVNAQKKQGKGIKFYYYRKPVFRKINEQEDCVILVEEITITMTIIETKREIPFRLTTIISKQQDSWKVIHIHGSSPQESEGDAWRINEFEKKTAELQKLVDQRTEDLKQSLENLKATQSQLIHAEKMASLGELTAGIAHEIQNPLNFVNNFSDVNTELLDELITAAEKGDLQEVADLAKDIKANEAKITHHGQRADHIVKSMLQHSRSTEGKKELTDLNQLADEYLRLAYHGMRAKDKSFNAILKTKFDKNITPIQINPQDIGRVLLNIISNAFHAVYEKQKNNSAYTPAVSIQTQKTAMGVEIAVSDNGYGIPKEMQEKIFQPFFTTKPTGQGTGLGLSLSYDIVKAHKGAIKVDSTPSSGSEFIIQLPYI